MSVLVLVVDDEPDVEALFRQQLRRDLHAQRFVMDFAASATDALSRIADPIKQTLILIFSDINMPGMTGLEMLPKVRKLRPEVPIIMMTAYGDPETRRKAIEGGATGLLTKPIDFALLGRRSIRGWNRRADRRAISHIVPSRSSVLLIQPRRAALVGQLKADLGDLGAQFSQRGFGPPSNDKVHASNPRGPAA